MGILQIVIALFFNAVAGIILLRMDGVPFVASLFIATAVVTIGTIFMWAVGARLALYFLKITGDYFKKITWDETAVDFLHIRRPLRALTKRNKEFRTHWGGMMAKQTTVIIFLLLCIPFVPYLPALATIALRGSKNPERRKRILLFAAAAIRTFLVVAIVYYLFPVDSIS